MNRPFWPMAGGFLGPDGLLYFNHTSRLQLQVFRPDGTLQRTIELNRPAVPITPQQLAAERDRMAATMAEPRRSDFLRAWNQVELPRTLPYYYVALPDRLGNVWVLDCTNDLAGELHWTVVDGSGRELARVITPPRFIPTDFGTDHRTGVWRDELDVNYVRVYELARRRSMNAKLRHHRIRTAVKPATRARRITQFVDMLRRRETL